MNLEIIKLTSCYVPSQKLKRAALFFKKHLKVKEKELVIVFVDLKKSKQLNNMYRKINKPTDILSFSAIEPGSLGELVICMDIIKKQSLEYKMSQSDELAYMLLHGMLHLLGHDHEKKAEAKKMYLIQDNAYSKYLNWQKKK